MLRRTWPAPKWTTLASSSSRRESFFAAAWQAIRRVRGDDLKREQFSMDIHYLFLLTSVRAALQSGQPSSSVADIAEKTVQDAKAMSTDDMYAHVNRSISSSLSSLAQRMHQLRLEPPSPPAAQPIAQSSHDDTPSSCPPLPTSPGRQESSAADVHLGHEHTGSDAASIIAQEIEGEQRSANEAKGAPFEASRWLAGRDKVTDKASRDELLRSLAPLEVPEGDQLTAESYRAALQQHLDFQLSIRKSGIDHEYAGDGVWLEGVADMGQVVAVHPGVVYSQAFHTEMLNFPNVARDNDFLLARYDNTLIDANSWGRGQANARAEWVQHQHPLDCALNLVEGRHPLACGHYINHPPKGLSPNVMIAPFNLQLPVDEEHLREFFPYVACSATWAGILQSSVAGLALVARRRLQDEELLMDYRLNPHHPRPAWYDPVDSIAENRRWS